MRHHYTDDEIRAICLTIWNTLEKEGLEWDEFDAVNPPYDYEAMTRTGCEIPTIGHADFEAYCTVSCGEVVDIRDVTVTISNNTYSLGL